MTLPTEELLTVQEVADLARVSIATVSAWARDDVNDLGQRKIGRQWRFSRNRALQFLGLEVAS